MSAIPQQILKLVLDNNACPIDDWLRSIRDKTTRARIVRQIDKLARGNFGDYKDVGKGIKELRLHFGAGYRVYYGRVGNTIVVLLGGGDKSTQTADIAQAQYLWEVFDKENVLNNVLLQWTQPQTADSNEAE